MLFLDHPHLLHLQGVRYFLGPSYSLFPLVYTTEFPTNSAEIFLLSSSRIIISTFRLTFPPFQFLGRKQTPTSTLLVMLLTIIIFLLITSSGPVSSNVYVTLYDLSGNFFHNERGSQLNIRSFLSVISMSS